MKTSREIEKALHRQGFLTHKQACAFLGTDSQTVNQFKKANQLLCVQHKGKSYYPKAQFELNNVSLKIFIQTLNILKDTPHTGKLFFFSEGQVLLGGRTPMEVLQEQNNLNTVLILAKEYAKKIQH